MGIERQIENFNHQCEQFSFSKNISHFYENQM